MGCDNPPCQADLTSSSVTVQNSSSYDVNKCLLYITESNCAKNNLTITNDNGTISSIFTVITSNSQRCIAQKDYLTKGNHTLKLSSINGEQKNYKAFTLTVVEATGNQMEINVTYPPCQAHLTSSSVTVQDSSYTETKCLLDITESSCPENNWNITDSDGTISSIFTIIRSNYQRCIAQKNYLTKGNHNLTLSIYGEKNNYMPFTVTAKGTIESKGVICAGENGNAVITKPPLTQFIKFSTIEISSDIGDKIEILDGNFTMKPGTSLSSLFEGSDANGCIEIPVNFYDNKTKIHDKALFAFCTDTLTIATSITIDSNADDHINKKINILATNNCQNSDDFLQVVKDEPADSSPFKISANAYVMVANFTKYMTGNFVHKVSFTHGLITRTTTTRNITISLIKKDNAQ